MRPSRRREWRRRRLLRLGPIQRSDASPNFTEADLPGLLAFLHRRGVRGYVTFNTLVFPNEMVRAERFARAVIAAGVDAAIVQDVGICRLIRSLSPDFPLHASTQMTITRPAGVEFARGLGCQLVVLAREVPVREMATLRAATAGRSPWKPSCTAPSAWPIRVNASPASRSEGARPIAVFAPKPVACRMP
jgi:hypothetical protein